MVPPTATYYNGVELPEVCISTPGPHNVYAIGDWGGLVYKPFMPPVPADKRSKLFPKYHRRFIEGVDDRAQLKVATQMRTRSVKHPPDYVLNVGDNFYWGGIAGKCGEAPFTQNASAQWLNIFENVYWGPGLEGKPWLGVLGNHDFGGYKFTTAWQEMIGYSWGGGGSTGRWITVALYYAQRVRYTGYSVDYLFVDTNAFEAWRPDMNGAHNICGLLHNTREATCGGDGPRTVYECHTWFSRLWDTQQLWMEDRLKESTATFQVIVTHMPPHWGQNDWKCLAERYGIDLFVSGHVHKQRVYGPDAGNNILGKTCVVITGGGGGITSEEEPKVSGEDNAYGFIHITFSETNIRLEAISHTGLTRSISTCPPRQAVAGPYCAGSARVV